MKIIILHGEDTEKSYYRLKKFVEAAKKRSWEVIYVDDSGLSIRETLSGTSLFGKERFFILKDIKKLGKKELEWLTNKTSDLPGNLIIYYDGTLSPTFIKSVGKATVEVFTLPKLIWNFLNSLYPGNSVKSIQMFHQIILAEPPELIFSLISKLFKDLYWVKVDSKTIEYPSWRLSKLTSQSAKYNINKISEIISDLVEIDFNIKRNKTDLVSSLDLVILKHLE